MTKPQRHCHAWLPWLGQGIPNMNNVREKEVHTVREMLKHNSGRIFVGVLFLSIVGMLFITRFFSQTILVFGWMTLPLFCGLIFVAVWLAAYLIYFFKFWPYR